jgi:hypothetical protein
MGINTHLKKEKCLSEIINIIKKHNIKLSDIIKSYINNFQTKFTQEDKIIQYNNYLEFLYCNGILNQKNINEDYVFI